MLVGEASIPAALQEALQARLDRLDAEARELLTTAAVIGRSFGLPLLERLLPRARLLPTLSELQWLQLVVEERSGAAPEYRFRHGLVQEAAYGTLLEARRRELHLRVGEALVELHRDSPAEVYGLLAHHFAEADEPERAVEYLLKAGDAARAVYAEDEAIELYRRALGFMEWTGDDARARATLLKIALTHHLAFDFRAANEAFGEAFADLCPRPAAGAERADHLGDDGGLGPSGGTGAQRASPRSRSRATSSAGSSRSDATSTSSPISPSASPSPTTGGRTGSRFAPTPSWSDGAPVTADDFAFTFAQMAEDEWPAASWLDGLSASALDERTLELRLASHATTSCTCSPSRRSSPGRGTSTSGRDVTGIARSRSSGTARSSSPAATRTASCSRPPRAGAGRAETSAR